jgi:hypothetical protein
VPLYHVTLTIGGEHIEPSDVLDALKRLADEQPFLLSGRYAGDRAEVRYWEEAGDCGDAAALALRLWGEHRRSAALPPWRVLALEVVDESVHRERSDVASVMAVGAWRRF